MRRCCACGQMLRRPGDPLTARQRQIMDAIEAVAPQGLTWARLVEVLHPLRDGTSDNTAKRIEALRVHVSRIRAIYGRDAVASIEGGIKLGAARWVALNARPGLRA